MLYNAVVKKSLVRSVLRCVLSLVVYSVFLLILLWLIDSVISTDIDHHSAGDRETEFITRQYYLKIPNHPGKALPATIWLYRHESLTPKSAATKRILYLGDSWVWGTGLNNPNLIAWQQLKNQLLADGYSVEIIALGVAGYNTIEQYTILRDSQVLEDLKPDLVIIQFVQNDTEAISFEFDTVEHQKHYRWLWKDLFAHRPTAVTDLLSKSWPNIYTKINLLTVEKYDYLDQSILEPFGRTQVMLDDYLMTDENLQFWQDAALEPLVELLGETQIPWFYVTCPVNEADWNKIESIFDQHQIKFYNFQTSYDQEVSVVAGEEVDIQANPWDEHPGPKLTQYCANKIRAVLEEDYSWVLGKPGKKLGNELIINDWTPYRQLKFTELTKHKFSLVYPQRDDPEGFLHWPIWQPYIKLNFQFPVNLGKIILTGGGDIKSAQLWIDRIHPQKGYDDQSLQPLTLVGTEQSSKQGMTDYIFEVLPVDRVTALNINLETLNGKSTPVVVRFELAE